jgi:uncharacterized repeat protein (TIGR03803 family)
LPRNAHYEAPGCGVVFRLAPDGTETAVYSFSGDPDGAQPNGHLILDSAGNLYGTTTYGGAENRGTVFEISPSGSETVLHAFEAESGQDGAFPLGGVVMDANGNLYGATSEGGPKFLGAIYKIAPGGAETVLYTFNGNQDGYAPSESLVMDGAGNLYGTTTYGGGQGAGTVFKITPDGALTTLYRFRGNGGYGDGEEPDGLIMDASGNLYGITRNGGGFGRGMVFEVTPNGTETALYNFKNDADGYLPDGDLAMDASGNLYGATFNGGTGNGTSYDGTVFKLAPDGAETVLYDFSKSKGYQPLGNLLKDSSGYFYGTTSGDGPYKHYSGVVYRLIPRNRKHRLRKSERPCLLSDAARGEDPRDGRNDQHTACLFGLARGLRRKLEHHAASG